MLLHLKDITHFPFFAQLFHKFKAPMAMLANTSTY